MSITLIYPQNVLPVFQTLLPPFSISAFDAASIFTVTALMLYMMTADNTGLTAGCGLPVLFLWLWTGQVSDQYAVSHHLQQAADICQHHTLLSPIHALYTLHESVCRSSG